MQITQLRGLRVISLSETLKMGKVEDALLDPTAHWVAGGGGRCPPPAPQPRAASILCCARASSASASTPLSSARQSG